MGVNSQAVREGQHNDRSDCFLLKEQMEFSSSQSGSQVHKAAKEEGTKGLDSSVGFVLETLVAETLSL